MAFQSNEELIRVADEWFRNFCPSNLVKDGPRGTKNAELIMGRCLQKYGILTISGMTESAYELGPAGKLALIPAPKVLTAAEKFEIEAKKAEERMRRDYLDSIKPQPKIDYGAEARKKVEKEMEAKEQADAEVQINNEILRYECYRGPNQIDHGKSDGFRKDLLKIEVRRNGKRDAKLTLEAVRKAISNLP